MARFDRITLDSARLGGKPCIRGLRISVGMIAEMIAGGKDTATILDEYPVLEAEDIQQVLAYSAALADNEYYLDLRQPA